MPHKAKYYIALIVVSTLLITYLHLRLFRDPAPYIVLEELYYIPLLVAAFMFGLRGALLTYFFVSLLYLPFLFGQWAVTVLSLIDRILHLFFTGIFAFVAGFLIDRERRREHRLEKDRYLAGLGQVAATIVHDLRNPLMTILGFARRIQAGKTNMDTAIQAIIGSAENMQKIVNGALDFAKPMELELREEDIVKIVRQACDSCRTKAEERGVILSMDAPGHPIMVPIDGLHLQRAVINLIDNSIEASPKGQSILISTWSDKSHVVIQLKDHGSGMDRETLENIFIPFYSKKNSGTGLGMAIVKKIVEAHHGKIQVKSRPGLGTEVTIELLCRPETEVKTQKKEEEI